MSCLLEGGEKEREMGGLNLNSCRKVSSLCLLKRYVEW